MKLNKKFLIFLGGLLLTSVVIKVIKTKDTESIALGMYLMQVVGIGLWLVHGLAIQDVPLISANSISLILSATILAYKIKYK